MANEFDSIVPNTQTPKLSSIGTSGNKWDEMHSSVGCFDTVIVSGLSIQPYDDSMVQAGLFAVTVFGTGLPPPPPLSYIVVHNLGTEFVDVQFYDITKETVQPDSIIVIDKDTIKITFVEPQEGTALIQQGKILGL